MSRRILLLSRSARLDFILFSLAAEFAAYSYSFFTSTFIFFLSCPYHIVSRFPPTYLFVCIWILFIAVERELICMWMLTWNWRRTYSTNYFLKRICNPPSVWVHPNLSISLVLLVTYSCCNRFSREDSIKTLQHCDGIRDLNICRIL